MSQSLRSCPNAHRLLLRMPKAIRPSFSSVQMEALELALVPRTHKIDVRFLLPLMGKGAYFVLAAGPNRRRDQRARQERSPHAAFSNLKNAIDLNQSLRLSPHALRFPNAFRLLQRMPTEISATFTPEQLQAMENALIPRSHLIDIRLSLPMMGKGAYMVLAAGPDTRSHYKNIQNGNPFVMPTVVASVTLAALSIAGLVQLKGSALLQEEDPVFAKEAFHPTVVPFKKNRAECLESGRRWIDDQCIDEVHDPDF
ncbi:MAG: hypothetical protein AB8B99_04300 [Phormidesmis sp.]